ncbi:MAG: Na/Pi cotransporter family protein [Sphingobacteriales bacterium]|nr:Na/Pi cotransporter family protein [Sphingobacteriales bacterium]
MTFSVDFWKMLAGVAIFLLGIRWMEESLHQLAGRQFKLFLRKQTASRVKAIGGGALVTAALQSSSVTSLMVLAFVGAGIITMQNALAVLLGANLGTTVTGWIMAGAGFTVNIEQVALPVAGLAGLGYALFNRAGRWYNWCRFFLGFSFLFIGLGYIRTGMEGLVTILDPGQYAGAPLLVFFGAGFVITTLIQSSSATMAIALSALYTGVIQFNDAVGIILGSELGTTIKLFIAGINGAAAKKRVALGNFLFNMVTVGLVLIFLAPLSHFVQEVLGIRNSLLALVFFQSLVNLLTILFFSPFLGKIGRFLEKRYAENKEESHFIHKVSPLVPSAALVAMENESTYFFHIVLDYAWHSHEWSNPFQQEMELPAGFTGKTVPGKYEYIKLLHGELHQFYIQLQKHVAEREELEKANRLISSVRNLMYAAKSMKDAIPDMEQLENSANDIKYAYYLKNRELMDRFCKEVYGIEKSAPAARFAELARLYQQVTTGYTQSLKDLYRETTAGSVNETEITTLLNFNREIFTAYKSILFGVKDLLFDKEQAKYFDELPGFIR